MNDVGGAVAFACLLILAAGFVSLRVWQATRSTVRWMRPVGSRLAHAVTKVELESELAEVEAVARCARWSMANLECDDVAERCAACVREVERLEPCHRD